MPPWLQISEDAWQVAYRDLAVAIGFVFVAIILGMITPRLARRIAERRGPELMARLLGGFAPRLGEVVGAAVAAIVLAAAMGVRGLDAPAALLLTIGLGVAVFNLVRHAARALGLGAGPALSLGGLALIAVVASRLGGLQPLADGLDRASIAVGDGRVSLFDIVNAAGLSLLLFLAARAVLGLSARWIGGVAALDPAQRVLFQKLAQIAVITVAIFMGIDLLDIDLTALALFSGAFGLAIGFGLQKTFGNLIAGLILLMDRSIKPGDVIAVGTTFGWVNKIGVRAVSVLTRDGKEHLIPNEKLMTEEVENWSYSSRDVRVHVGFLVSYDCDLRLVQRLAVEAADISDRVLEEPRPVCWIKAFGDNGVEFDLRIWIDSPEAGVGNVTSEVFLRLWDLFKEHGVTMPYPQRDLRIRSMPDGWPQPGDDARPGRDQP